MRIAYKCRCMAVEVEIDIPDRRPGTDVAAWMENLQRNVGFDHSALSPICRHPATQYLKIPNPEDAPQLGTSPTRQ